MNIFHELSFCYNVTTVTKITMYFTSSTINLELLDMIQRHISLVPHS